MRMCEEQFNVNALLKLIITNGIMMNNVCLLFGWWLAFIIFIKHRMNEFIASLNVHQHLGVCITSNCT
eukprot:m.100724 g.100724  ORF g.100724 m.100724 type:complete len:68 (-) comp12554_c0_seq12:898-1101(-)